jgi:hypothetical protein
MRFSLSDFAINMAFPPLRMLASAEQSERTPGSPGIAEETSMFRQSFLALFAVTAFAAGHPAGATVSYEPVYITDGQYTATLKQRSHRWLLQPLRGDQVEVIDRSPACGSHAPLPKGLWFVSQDSHGQAQLVAPSVTPLPAGFPQHVALRACGSGGDELALYVPPVALNWINDFVGSILIDD